MNKIKKPAIRQSGGKITEAKGVGAHNTIEPPSGQRGFTTTQGGFVGRGKGAKIAAKSGQSKKDTGKLLHSEDLKGHKSVTKK